MLSLRRHESTNPLGRRGNAARGRHERLPSIDDIDHDTSNANINSIDNNVHFHGNTQNGNSTSAIGIASSSREDVEAGIFETNPAIPDETTELTSNSGITTTQHHLVDAAASIHVSTRTRNSDLNSTQTNNSTYHTNQAIATPAIATTTTATTEEEEEQLQSSPINLSEEANALPDTDNLQSRLQSQLEYLSEQSQIYKHTTRTWTVIISLLLLRIWLESMISADIGLTSISLICTSYFLRWKQYRALQVQRFDERIEYLTRLTNDEESNNSLASNDRRSDSDGGNDDENDEEVGLSDTSRSRRWRRQNHNRLRMEFAREDHVDFEMLSFQAQLALALMESQQMMQNGVNIRQQEESHGVSDENKQKWHSFEYTNGQDYHSLIQKNSKWNDGVTEKSAKEDYNNNDEEDPTCCICLCEYEEGDKMVQLPCGHVFHANCIDSWTQSHSNCPLCNLELQTPDNDEHDP